MSNAVEAEVVENAELSIQYKPGSPIVIIGLEQMRERIAEIAAEYEGVEIPKEYVGQAKRERAYLNGLKASIEQRRKDVKREYSAPVTAFELEVKDLLAPLDAAILILDTPIKAFEAWDKAEKKNEILKHWQAFAGPIAETVDFELIFDPKWLNKSVNVMAACEAVEEAVMRIAADEKALTDLALPYPDEAKTEYFATLDMSKAIAASKAKEQAVARTAAFEAEKAENLRWQQERQAEQVAAAALRAQEAAERNTPSEEAPATTEAVSVDEGKPADASETPQEWKFVVTCTRTQLDGIIAYLASVDLHGKAIR